MSGVSVSITPQGLDAAIAAITRLTALELSQLAYDASAILESSARDRFDRKTDPEGLSWSGWSAEYAAARGDQHSLLLSDGSLRDSITGFALGDSAVVGSNLVYGAIHQVGGADVGKNIPARAYLGASDDDIADIAELGVTYAEGLMQ